MSFPEQAAQALLSAATDFEVDHEATGDLRADGHEQDHAPGGAGLLAEGQ